MATLTYVYPTPPRCWARWPPGPSRTATTCASPRPGLSAPRGWEVIRLVADEEPRPSTDDLLALADAVREVGLSYDPALTPTSADRERAGIVELGRRGHLTVLADPGT